MNVDHLGDVTKEYNRTDNNTYNIDNREFAVNNETRKEYNQYVKDQRQIIYNYEAPPSLWGCQECLCGPPENPPADRNAVRPHDV